MLRAVGDLRTSTFLNRSQCSLAAQDGPNRAVSFCGGSASSAGESAMFCYCKEARVLFLSHKACWQAINRPALLPSSYLLRLARHTRPIVPPRVLDSHSRMLSRQTRVAECSADTPLARLVTQMAQKLPLELQCMILDYLTGSLFASLLKATSVSSRLLKRLDFSIPAGGPRTIDLGMVGPVHNLYVQTLDIFGTTYLAYIGYNRLDASFSPSASIPVKSSPFRGVQYALGEFGLRGLRILYEDGTRSAWLGDASYCWYGTAEGRDFRMLRILADVSHVYT